MSKIFFQFFPENFMVIALCLLVDSNQANATGSFSGGGGDRVGMHKMQAWVTNDHELSWCINIGPNFGLNVDEAKVVILQAMNIWREYLEGKNLTSPRTGELDHPRLVLNPVFHPSCVSNTVVTFFLGIDNAEIAETRKKFIDPAAFSKLVKYDKKLMSGHGYVWVENGTHPNLSAATVSPDRLSDRGIQWRFRNNFLGLILHELGHILGCDHIPGTIMDENIVHIIRHTDLSQELDESIQPLVKIVSDSEENFSDEETALFLNARDIFLSRIDFYNELFFLPQTGGRFSGLDKVKLANEKKPRIAAGFERLTGEKLKTEVVASVVDFYNHSIQGMPGYSLAQLKISEAKQDEQLVWMAQEKESWTFKILIEPQQRENLSSISPSTVFRKVGPNKTFEDLSPSSTRFATIVSKEHKGRLEEVRIPIIVQRNRGKFNRADAWNPYTVQMYFEDGEESSRLFFRASIPELLLDRSSSVYIPGGYKLPKGLSPLDFLMVKPLSDQ